jgi:signal transduction histidine kinase
MSEDALHESSPRGSDWTWLWEVYVVGVCIVAIVAVVLLEDRFPGNVAVAAASLSAIALCVLVFGRRATRLPELDWRAIAYVGAVIALWVIAIRASPVAVASVPAIYPMVFSTLPLRAALVVTTVINLLPLTLQLIGSARSPNLPLAIAITLLGVVATPVIGTVIVKSTRQRRELAIVVDELAASRAETARLSREAGAAAERERLAREIHDTLAQGFTSIVTLAQAIEAELDADPVAAKNHLQMIADSARENLADARTMVAGMSPAALDEQSLPAAIRRQCDRLSAETGITVTMSVNPDLPALGMATDVVLLRAAQEALANIRRHAQATAVRIDLAGTGDGVRLSLSDNGVGLTDGHTDGFGLRGMRARLAQVGGTMSVKQEAGGGLTLLVEVPT